MAERKAIKPRRCRKCGKAIETDARGIETHAANCDGSS